MKKFILILSMFVLFSCTGMRDAQRDDYMYDSANPVEIIEIQDKTGKQVLAEEKWEERFSSKRFYRTIIQNKGPNRFIPSFPELFRDDHVDEGTVFTFR